MAAWADFLALVGQHCANAPSVAIEFWARQAAREFCGRTLVHQATLAAFNTQASVPEYTLSCGTGLQPAKLLAVRGAGRKLRLITPAELDALPDLDTKPGTPEAAYLSGTSKLTLYPAPSNVVPVSVRMALMPTQDAAALDDDLFFQYASAISFGAAKMLALSPDGRDDRLAMAMSAMFENEIGLAISRTYFNRARSGPRTTPTWC